jgi:lipoprotein NlpD
MGMSARRLTRRVQGLLIVLSLASLAACTSAPRNRAPVEDRPVGARPAAQAPAPTPAGSNPAGSVVAPSGAIGPNAENAGKPGFYTVRPGDTLIRIGLEAGQSWRDIARWNDITNPNLIEVGQVLRITPPPGAAPVVAASPTPSSPAVTATTSTRAGTATAASPASQPQQSSNDEDVGWVWPATGTVLAGFDEARNKGIDIGGRLGDPVLAAGDGRVVYAGSGLRGYGNLIIIKHNNTFLSAYAHNQTLLVREDQNVRKGQKIAEMGQSDADRVKLHFEIRRQGRPVDPTRYLPTR